MNQDQKDALKMTAKEVWLEIRYMVSMSLLVAFIFGLIVSPEIFLPILGGLLASAFVWALRLAYKNNLAYVIHEREYKERSAAYIKSHSEFNLAYVKDENDTN